MIEKCMGTPGAQVLPCCTGLGICAWDVGEAKGLYWPWRVTCSMQGPHSSTELRSQCCQQVPLSMSMPVISCQQLSSARSLALTPFARAPQVFTTCGSARKRKYLLDTFPGLRDDHIGNSRSTAFEHMIMHMVRPPCNSHLHTVPWSAPSAQ